MKTKPNQKGEKRSTKIMEEIRKEGMMSVLFPIKCKDFEMSS